jgi:hypothetical protein
LDAAKLLVAIEHLITSRHRGDDAGRTKAVAEIRRFRESAETAHVRRAAVDAEAVAGNPDMVERNRLLGEIAARLNAVA